MEVDLPLIYKLLLGNQESSVGTGKRGAGGGFVMGRKSWLGILTYIWRL